MKEKYYGQICQDDEVNKKFRELHYKLVNEIISFCKENNIEAEEVILRADGLKGSIPYEEWQPCTDSCLEMYKEDSRHELPILISL